MSNQKGFIGIVIIGAAALILVGLAGKWRLDYQIAYAQKQNEEGRSQQQFQQRAMAGDDNKKEDPATYKKDCDKEGDQTSKDNCYLSIAKAGQDISICDKVKSQIVINKCYLDIAVAEQDLSVCDKAQDQPLKIIVIQPLPRLSRTYQFVIKYRTG